MQFTKCDFLAAINSVCDVCTYVPSPIGPLPSRHSEGLRALPALCVETLALKEAKLQATQRQSKCTDCPERYLDQELKHL